jgi:hypothetical protein
MDFEKCCIDLLRSPDLPGVCVELAVKCPSRITEMNVPSFHDGRFDGFWIPTDDTVHLFLRTQGGERFTRILKGVERLNLSEIREGNIIFDLVFRDAEGLAISDME